MLQREQGRSRRWAGLLTAVLVVLAVGAGAGWGAAAVLRPPARAVQSLPYTTVQLAQGEVGSSLQLNVAAEWGHEAVGSNQARGTVTAVLVEPGAQVHAGDGLYAVDLAPVQGRAGGDSRVP